MSAAAANRERKAWVLAPALYRRGMTVDDLLALPYASKDRKTATVKAFARSVYAEAGVTSKTSTAGGAPTATVGGETFPRKDGATCPCGVWHRRYGPSGHGFLCPACALLGDAS